MKVVIAPNAFKGSLSAQAVARHLARGVCRAVRAARVVRLPLADGGEGTVQVLLAARGGRRFVLPVPDARGRPVLAEGAVLSDGTGVLEAAAASGLARLPGELRDPRVASSRGTGELLKFLLDRGCRRILLGLGGTATCDAGAGALTALGMRFLDRHGRDLPPGGAALGSLERIDRQGLDPRLAATEVVLLCDVDAPLLGPRGAARQFAPQKGADSAAVDELEAALERFAAVVGARSAEDPGTGAAGGMGAGLAALLPRVRLVRGAAFLAAAAGLEDQLSGADLAITGEGRLDGQTAQGKAVAEVARSARRAGVPAVAVVGSLGRGWQALLPLGLTAALPLVGEGVDRERAMREAPRLLERAAERVATRLL